MRKNIVFYIRLFVSVFILILLFTLNINETLSLVLSLMAFIVVSYDVLIKAFKNIIRGHIFDENFLMIIASIGAFITKEYAEAIMVMTLYQIGEYFQKYSVNKSREAISNLMELEVDEANLLVGDEINVVDVYDVKVGDTIVVKTGEKVPLDGIVTKGSADIDSKSLTGESKLRSVSVNDEVISGTINQNGLIYVKVNKEYSDSTAQKIIELVEDASNNTSKTENFISVFAKYYTPIVVLLAVFIAGFMPLILGDTSLYLEYIHRACSFLVISCPCALVISVPLTYFSGMGGASKLGILIKGSNYVELLAKAKTVCFDKTGTLTKGNFKVTKINNFSNEDLLKLASYGENFSNHPLKNAILESMNDKLDFSLVSNLVEEAGFGLKFNLGNDLILVGNDKLLRKEKVDFLINNEVGTIIYIAKNNKYLGNIVINDEIKDNSKELINNLKETNINTMMLSGDSKEVCEDVCNKLNLDKYYSNLLPQDKVRIVKENLKEKESLVYVGDGINDAPCLVVSDVGISMGNVGSDAALEASDIVIGDDDILKVDKAIKISKKIMKIVYQNIIFTLTIKFVVLILGALGYANMFLAIFADVGVAIIAILNASRALYNKKI